MRAKEEKVEKKPFFSAPVEAPETKAEVTKAASVVQISTGLNGTIEMETDQPTAGGAVSSAVEMGGKDEDDKVSQ